MGKGKAKREAKKEERKKTAVHKVEAKGATKRTHVTAKQNKKTNAKTGRVGKREATQQTRIASRKVKGGARVSNRLEKKLDKKYGGLMPENAQAIAEANAYAPEVLPLLEEQGIEVEDRDDPIEIMSKYVQSNEDMDDPIDEEDYDRAYFCAADHFDGVEEYEHFNWKASALRGVQGAIQGVVGEFGKYADEIEVKQKSGQPLTKEEQAILNAKKKVKESVKDNILDQVKDFLPWVVGALLLYIVARKFIFKAA